MAETTPIEIDEKVLADIAGRGITIPPQPKVLMEIEAQTGRPRVNVKAIAELIAKDPALLAGVFKVVNSPAMGLRRPVDSAETAISILGLKQVTNLVKSIAVRQVLSGASQGYERFWERSGEIADIAATVAQKRISVCNVFPDQAYMAGLFHDCGVPVLMQRFPDYCRILSGSDEWPMLAAEDRLFDTDHCVVGYLVSKSWHLPDFIQRGIRYHHEIDSVEDEARTVVAILQMATHLFNLQGKQMDDDEWTQCWQGVIEELGISPDGLSDFEGDVLETLASQRSSA